MQILVDAPVWLDYFTGVSSPETDRLDRLIGREALVVADMTMAEVLCGLPNEAHRRQAEEALRRFWQVSSGGMEVAVRSALCFHVLRSEGLEADPLRCQVVACCLHHGLALLTRPDIAEPFVKHLGVGAPGVG